MKVGLSGRPTHDDIKDMKYLRALINGVQLPIVSRAFQTDLEPRYQRCSDYIHLCTRLFSRTE